MVGHALQEPGWPDRYVCHARWRGWLEFKDEDGQLDPKQRIVLRELCRRGCPAFVLRFPNRVEHYTGSLLFTFDSARDLINCLQNCPVHGDEFQESI